MGLRRELRGDLDWIILKADQRDRARRYETANAFALDIERHLEDKPMVARPPTIGYTAAKFVRRHRLGVAMAADGGGGPGVLVMGIARERNHAERPDAKAQAISRFLEDMLKSADPWQGGARQTTVVEALRAGTARVNAGTIPDPIVSATIKRTIGTVYLSLGRVPEADTLLRAALAERIAHTGAEQRGDRRELFRPRPSVLDPGEVRLGRTGVRTGARHSTAAARRARYSGRREPARSRGPGGCAGRMSPRGLTGAGGARILRVAHGERHPSLAVAMGGSSAHGSTRGNCPRRIPSRARPSPCCTTWASAGAPQVAGIMNDLALSRAYEGDHAEAMALMHQVVSLDSALFGPSHPDLAAHLENLGLVYDLSGFPDSNVAVLRQALAMRRAVLADDNPAIGRSLFNLAVAEYLRRDYAAAEPLFEEALARMRQAYGPEHTDVVYATATLGRNQYYLGRLRGRAESAMGAWREGSGRPTAAGRLREARAGDGVPALDQHRWAEAEPVALRVLAIRDSLADTLARQSAGQLATLYEGWGKPGRAAEYPSGRRPVGRSHAPLRPGVK